MTTRFVLCLVLSFFGAQLCADLPTPVDTFIRADTNHDSTINVSDGVYLTNWLYQSGPDPVVLDSADVNDDGAHDPSDVAYFYGFLLQGGAAPPPPFYDPVLGAPNLRDGLDPTPDGIEPESDIDPIQTFQNAALGDVGATVEVDLADCGAGRRKWQDEDDDFDFDDDFSPPDPLTAEAYIFFRDNDLTTNGCNFCPLQSTRTVTFKFEEPTQKGTPNIMAAGFTLKARLQIRELLALLQFPECCFTDLDVAARFKWSIPDPSDGGMIAIVEWEEADGSASGTYQFNINQSWEDGSFEESKFISNFMDENDRCRYTIPTPFVSPIGNFLDINASLVGAAQSDGWKEEDWDRRIWLKEFRITQRAEFRDFVVNRPKGVEMKWKTRMGDVGIQDWRP